MSKPQSEYTNKYLNRFNRIDLAEILMQAFEREILARYSDLEWNVHVEIPDHENRAYLYHLYDNGAKVYLVVANIVSEED